MKIAAAVCAAALVAAPAAQAASPYMPMSYAKHQAWELATDYINATDEGDGYTVDSTLVVHRVNRSVVDVKTMVDYEDLVENNVYDPTIAPTVWHERDSWTMRYRAGQARNTIHMEAYFPKDRWASTDPTDKKFGGLALSTRTWWTPWTP